MGGLALLIIYTVLIGLAELQFGITVGRVLQGFIRLLLGAGQG